MANMGPAATPGKPVWFVAEDNRGRYRQFPEYLNHMVEEKFQEWTAMGGPAEFVVAYCWPARGTRPLQDYEITFHNMKQTNLTHNTARSVMRLLRSDP